MSASEAGGRADAPADPAGDDVAGRLAAVRADVARHARAHGREPASVRLLAVSKTRPVAAIAAAIAAGQRRFGENYADEAAAKIGTLGRVAPDGEPLEWHFVGAIQSRKCRLLAERFDWVQGVDRDKLVGRLADARDALLDTDPDAGPLNACIQVNLDGEASKAGVDPDGVRALADSIAARPSLRLRGLMAIPAPRGDLAGQRAAFARLAALQAELDAAHPGIDTLSCGMSGDLEAAIAEGATMVRVGTGIFGARAPRAPDPSDAP